MRQFIYCSRSIDQNTSNASGALRWRCIFIRQIRNSECIENFIIYQILFREHVQFVILLQFVSQLEYLSVYLPFCNCHMLQVSKQTYLYIALDFAISDLRLQKHRPAMEKLLLTLLQAKFEDHLKNAKPDKGKKEDKKKQNARVLNALQILQSEFPVGNDQDNNMKYCSVLYKLEFSKPMEQVLKVKKSELCLLECFSDENTKQKAVKKNAVLALQTKKKTLPMLQMVTQKMDKKYDGLKATLIEINRKYQQRMKIQRKERKSQQAKKIKQWETERRRQESQQKGPPMKRKKKH